jgi:uncharacterized protein (TIGR00299 family) protein
MRNYIRFESVGGASGDMILSALASVGADMAGIEKTINAFLPEHIHLVSEKVTESGLTGLRVRVNLHTHHHHHDHHGDHHHMQTTDRQECLSHPEWPDAHTHHHHTHHHEHRGLKEIEHLLDHAPVSDLTRQRAKEVFRTLAQAEATIHDKTPETVHFHEVGAWDSIADIAGTCLALEMLGVDVVETSAFPSGTGVIQCSHGTMPNPAPATLRLLKNHPILQTDEPSELVTPTAAAILTATGRQDERTAGRTLLRDAFSFGKRALHSRPNCLRAALYETAEKPADTAPFNETLTLLETNLDDCNPQWLPDLLQRLLDAGANDAWLTQVIMKKGRPAFVLSTLAKPALAQALAEIIFRAVPTLGIRGSSVTRATLERRHETIQTPHGALRVKIGSLNGEDLTRAPEFEDCAKLARENNLFPRGIAQLTMNNER